MSTTAAPVREDLKVGGHYTARANSDGTFDILDVCIFAEIPAGAKRNRDPIGRDWQEAALLQSKAREASGHLPPVHIYHTDEVSVKPSYAGKMRLRAVRQTVYEGQTLWATFADILGMPGEVFAKVKKGFLPYRSVEIHNWARPEIDSLALMDTDVPFFRLPMLTVGKVIQKDAEIFMDKRRPSQACRLNKSNQGGYVLFRFAERGTMAKDDEKDEDEGALNAPPKAGETQKESEADLDEKSEGPARKGPGGAEMEADGGEQPSDEDPDILDKSGDAEGKHPDAPQDSAMIEKALAPVTSMLQSLGSLVKQLNERLGPQPAPTEKHEAVSGVDLGKESMGQDFKDNKQEEIMADPKTPAKPENEKITFSSKDELKSFVGDAVKEATLAAVGPIKAELEAMKARQSEADKKEAIAARLAAAKKELTDNGQFVSEDLEKHLAESAAVSEEFLKKQVNVFKTTLPKEPPRSADEFESTLGREAEAGEHGDDAVNAFCAEYGAQHAAWAKKEMAKFRAFQKANASDTTAEEWLSVNFRSATMFDRNRV